MVSLVDRRNYCRKKKLSKKFETTRIISLAADEVVPSIIGHASRSSFPVYFESRYDTLEQYYYPGLRRLRLVYNLLRNFSRVANLELMANYYLAVRSLARHLFESLLSIAHVTKSLRSSLPWLCIENYWKSSRYIAAFRL